VKRSDGASLPLLDAVEPRRLAAPAADVELWRIDLRFQPSPTMQACLSPQERARSARFVFERDRRRFEAAHAALRQLLAERLRIAPKDLRFREGPHGKPALDATCHARPCAFNLSHCDDEAIVALAAQGDIGVDVELLRPMPDAVTLAGRNFSAEECAELERTDGALRDLAFLTAWTRKEACLKAVGSGLTIAPNTFTAGLDHGVRQVAIRTAQGRVGVTVQSLCHEQHLLVAWARTAVNAATIRRESART
jgi:4'-phosphopantetheinyl transferase